MSVTHVYAKALYQAAVDGRNTNEITQVCNELDTQLSELIVLIHSSKDLEIALQAPITTSKEKARVMKSLAAKLGYGRLMTDFLVLLANKGRLVFLSAIRDQFSIVRLKAEGGVSGVLTAAETVSQADIDLLAKSFSKKLGKKVAFQVKTDASLLAGIKVTVNGVTYDGTLRSQLLRLRDQFLIGIAGGN